MSYDVDDTITAVATARGPSGIGIVRLCGHQARSILAQMFRPSQSRSTDTWTSHTARHGWISDGRLTIDEVIVTYFQKPCSYTGDETIEISAHGNPIILDKITQLCCAKGARLAHPGEFTFRAFINGKMDLAEAEAVADIIAAKTARAAAAAMCQLKGAMSQKIELWRKKLIDLLSAIEVSLDYGEENIRFMQTGEIQAEIAALQSDIGTLLETAAKGMRLRNGLRVCIAGSPNVGKSSLLNALLERDRAIVSDIPGTTRDVIEELLDIQGFPVVISDTAGLRTHTSDPLEKSGHERTIQSLKSADVILWLTDTSRPRSPQDMTVGNILTTETSSARIIVVGTKIDLPCGLTDCPTLKISSKTGEGIKDLEAAIVSVAGSVTPDSADPLVTSIRHQDALVRAQSALKATDTLFFEKHTADAASSAGDSDDVLIAEQLREALNALGEITGETTPEDILENIFSRFCVGK
ncbi:MAG: tRNA uridine-5-carboxymethylaminomethyl(34) synthesis GTPase MnmE [Endomicrobiales bacterium]|jgi:tRNA modification GTPase